MDVGGNHSKWNTETMRECMDKWTLADDVALLKYLESFSQSILAKAHCTLKSLDNFETSLNGTCVDVRTASNRFQALADTQFVENRVYEEEDSTASNDTKQDDYDNREEASQNKVKEAVLSCLHTLDSKFETVQLSESDSEDEGFDNQLVLKPVNRYRDRPLPHLIGSEEFMNDDTLGLVPLSPEDSENEEESDETSSSNEPSSKSCKDDKDGLNLAQQLSVKLGMMEESSSSTLNSGYAVSTENEGSFLSKENLLKHNTKHNANNILAYKEAKAQMGQMNIPNDEVEDQNIIASGTLFDSDSDESATSASLKNEKTFQGNSCIFGQNIDLFGENEVLPKLKENKDVGGLPVKMSNKAAKENSNSSSKKIPKSGVSIYGKNVDLFGENPPSLPKAKVYDNQMKNNKDSIHPNQEGQSESGGKLFATDLSSSTEDSMWVDEVSIFDDNDAESDLFQSYNSELQKEDIFKEFHESKRINQNPSMPANKSSDGALKNTSPASYEVDARGSNLFEEDDTDLFSNLNLPKVLHPGLSLFSEDEDDVFSFKPKKDKSKENSLNSQDALFNDNIVNKRHRNKEKSDPLLLKPDVSNENFVEISRNTSDFLIKKSTDTLSNELHIDKDPTDSESSESAIESWLSETGTKIGTSNSIITGKESNDQTQENRLSVDEQTSENEKKLQFVGSVNGTNKKGSKVVALSKNYTEFRENESFKNKFGDVPFPGKLPAERITSLPVDLTMLLSSPRSSSDKTVDITTEKSFPEDGFPPIITRTLDCLVKDRARIQIKRRLPSRKSKHTLFVPKMEANLKQSTVLSPSTDEEDIFVIPSLDLQKEKSSNNLFSGNILLSPGTSFDEPQINLSYDGNKEADIEQNTNSSKILNPLEIASNDSNFSDLFDSPDDKSAVKYNTKRVENLFNDDDLFTPSKENNKLGDKKSSSHQVDIGKSIFDSEDDDDDDDLFSSTDIKNQNSKISSGPAFVDLMPKKQEYVKESNISGIFSDQVTSQRKSLSLFQDSSDDEEDLFSGMKSKLSNTVAAKNKVSSENEVQHQHRPSPSKQPRRPNQLEKKKVLDDPLMALTNTNLSE